MLDHLLTAGRDPHHLPDLPGMLSETTITPTEMSDVECRTDDMGENAHTRRHLETGIHQPTEWGVIGRQGEVKEMEIVKRYQLRRA